MSYARGSSSIYIHSGEGIKNGNFSLNKNLGGNQLARKKPLNFFSKEYNSALPGVKCLLSICKATYLVGLRVIEPLNYTDLE